MKFESLMSMVADLSFFDLATVVQLSGEDRATVRTQLYRWAKGGKLVRLRRGMYCLSQTYRRVPVNPAELANYLHRPSYLSGLWALGFYGLIPERVLSFTSVTTRGPRLFENVCGVFEYRHVKRSAFFGYRAIEIQGRKSLLAEPEKALLDYWHLAKAEWTKSRIEEMRFQNWDSVDEGRLESYSVRFDSPRLQRAVQVFWRVAQIEQEGTIEL